MRAVLIGGGEMVFFLARSFISKGLNVSVINLDLEECLQLKKSFKIDVINGDGSNPNILKKAKADEANVLIAATSRDHVNLACCQTGTVLFNIPYTLAIVNDPDNVEIFKKLGIKFVFNKTDLIVSHLEKSVESKYIKPLMSYAEEKLLFYQVELVDKMPAINRCLEDIGLPIDAFIVGLIRDKDFICVDKKFVFVQNDKILLATTPKAFSGAILSLCGNII